MAISKKGKELPKNKMLLVICVLSTVNFGSPESNCVMVLCYVRLFVRRRISANDLIRESSSSNLCPTEGGEEAAESIERHTSPSSLATLKQGSESLFQKFNFFQQLIGLFTMTGIREIFELTTCYKVNLPPLQTFC